MQNKYFIQSEIFAVLKFISYFPATSFFLKIFLNENDISFIYLVMSDIKISQILPPL